jgi:nucleotide-binding universal stress UspA family protein
MFERILLPLDGSGDWESLLPHLERLAASPGCEVLVLEAVPFLGTLFEMPKSLGGIDVGHCGDVDHAEKYVDSVAGRLRTRGIAARGLTEVGPHVRTIAAVARRMEATMVALAVREPAVTFMGLRRSAAERALSACSVPMYVVPTPSSEAQPAPPTTYGRIVVPLDGTPSSLDVIPAAAPFCRRFSAPLLFVHVVPSGEKAWQDRGVFQPALERAEQEGVPAETLLGKGDPTAEILRLCAGLGGSMIAMRTHLAAGETGHGIGSVTVRVLRAARVPLLIVRRRPEPVARKRSAS